MMKKWVSILTAMMLTITMIVSTAGGTVNAETFTENNYMYTVENGEATIVGYIGQGSIITTPTTLGGYPVTAIGDGAFQNDMVHYEITISQGVRSIGNHAFDASYVSKVALADSVTTIGDSAFENCENLKTVNLGSVRTIGDRAFYRCYALRSAAIPDSVEVIGDYAFAVCNELTEFTISANLRSLGIGAAHGCGKLLNYTVSEDNPYYCDIDGVLYTKDKTKVIHCPGTKTACFLPSSVTTIGEGAFMGCDLTGMPLPDGLKTIEKEAFRSCSYLTNIIIPTGITVIEEYAFADTGLKTIHIPLTVTEIKAGAFYRYGDTPLTVFYEGTQSQWEAIPIAEKNYSLTLYSYENYYGVWDTGDVTMDTVVNMQDVMYLYNGIAGKHEFNSTQKRAGNYYNYDFTLNMLDVLALYRNIAGLERPAI